MELLLDARRAHEHGKPVVGNSDLHDLRQLGRTYSAIDAGADPAAICEAIRHGRVTLHTEPAPLLEMVDVIARMTLRPRKQNTQALGFRPLALDGFGSSLFPKPKA